MFNQGQRELSVTVELLITSEQAAETQHGIQH